MIFVYMWSVLVEVFGFCVFFFNDTATTEIYTYGHTLSLHDALPISLEAARRLPSGLEHDVIEGGAGGHERIGFRKCGRGGRRERGGRCGRLSPWPAPRSWRRRCSPPPWCRTRCAAAP